MWNSSDGIDAETSQNDSDYMPPEKKGKKAESSEPLHEALECCKNKEIGVEEASAIYGVPKRSLQSHLKNNNFSIVDEKYRVFVLSAIPPEAEIDLNSWIKDLAFAQVTLTPIEVRRLGYELLSEKYNVEDLPKEKNCLLGRRWYENFTNKYLQLHVDHAYMKDNEDKSAKFYDALESLIKNNNLDLNRIYAVDGIELKFRASTCDDSRRIKLLQQRRTIYTDAKAVCCANPLGNFVPPLFLKPPDNWNCDKNCSVNDKNGNGGHGVLRRELKDSRNVHWKPFPSSEDLASIQKQIKNQLNKRHRTMTEENEEELREKLYEQFSQLRNKMMSKYESFLNEVTHDVFFSWLKMFVNFTGSEPQKKVLLLLSDPNHVKSFKILKFAQENGVVFLALPPRSLHKIHPLDGFTMSLNRNLSTCARRWLVKNPELNVQQVPLSLLFEKGYSEAANPVIAKNGFLYSGLWPVNRNVFKSMELGGESILLQKKSYHDCMKVSVGFESQNQFSLPGITNISDLQKFCRVCMKEKMYMKSIFEDSTSQPNYYGKKISDITNVPVAANDGLPEFLCQLCQVQLMDVSKVKSKIAESLGKLINLREAMNRNYYGTEQSTNDWFLSSFANETSFPSKFMEKILSKTFDMNSMCRICMAEKPLMTSIFYKSQNEFSTETCSKITEIAGCQVHIRDGLSASICPFCRTSINKTHEFIQKVINSDKRFREIVTEMKTRKN